MLLVAKFSYITHAILAIDDEKRLSLPLKEQLDIMLVRLDQAVLRAKKTKKIRSEIAMLKRFVFQ